MEILDSALESAHFEHLILEGFTSEHIWNMEQKGVSSVSQTYALKKNFKVWSDDEKKWLSSSGLYFPFTDNFGQVRCDNTIIRQGKACKYLTPCGAKTQAYLPRGTSVITEGYKDAERPNQGGCEHITGAVAGVSHIRKAIPANTGYTVIFDSDGWLNPAVMRSLLRAAIHLNGKIQLVPEMENYPKGGLCEFFKSGRSAADYDELIANAMHPDEIIYEWAKRWEHYPIALRAKCSKVAVVYACYLGKVA